MADASENEKKKAIFLDRDGTLIVDKVYLNDPDQIEYLPGVFNALVDLKEAGFVFAVVTNQSGVPRGKVTLDNLFEIHRRIAAAFSERGVEFSGFYYAPYLTESGHPMRKPEPGMLHQAAKEFGIDLSTSWMIGDRMLDVEAGHRAGTRSILVGSRETPSVEPQWQPPDFVCDGLLDAAQFILKTEGRS